VTELELAPLKLGVQDDEWSSLAAETGNIFGTPEWVSIWWRHYGGRRPLLATACRASAGRLAGVLPVYLSSRRPLRLARFIGHGPGDALGPICRSADRAEVAAALHRALDDWRAAVMVGEHFPRDEQWSTLLGARSLRQNASPVLAFDGATWESFLASASKNLRSRIGSRERRLAGKHQVEYRLSADPQRFSEDFDRLVALHRSRWPNGSSFTLAEKFHREFAAAALARGWARLWLLEIDGEARAAWYGFRFANVESYYQAGRDPDPRWDRYSLGFLLLVHSIREAAADGVLEYRFLRGGEAFKYQFATHDPGLETIVLARGAGGRAAVEAVTRLPRPLLRRLV
jgi:CelD/BcsL family acetyltransferase involved in cellulose biosynthesis